MKKTLAVAGMILCVAGSVLAQEAGPKEALAKLFTGQLDSVKLTDAFSRALPREKLSEVISGIEAQLGAFREVRGANNPFTVIFAKGTATAEIHMDAQGRLAGLRFTQLIPAAKDLDGALSRLRSLKGEVSYLVLENGQTLASYRSAKALAVGSSFKLAVLAAVQEAVRSGEHRWDEIVRLRADDRSLPSGILQDWPDGAALTVQTLATLMISISDNTAADTLIHLVGREAVERFSPRNRPFLTTSEAFKLKNPKNADLKEAYLSASETERGILLEQLKSRELPSPDLFTGGPVAPRIEWFFSVEELCKLMKRVSPLDLTTVNPGPASRENWKRVSFKGGSEPGVINLTVALTGKDRRRYCISATQNREDAQIDDTAFFAAFQGVLGVLAGGGATTTPERSDTQGLPDT
jgi:beta-lactamase class A